MKRTYIRDLNQNVGQEVVIKGWVNVRRDQGKMVFMDMRDMTGLVQCVVLPASQAIETAKEMRTEWVLSVTGVVNKRPEKNVKAGVQNGDMISVYGTLSGNNLVATRIMDGKPGMGWGK